jgi:hypothetical protein
MSALKSANKELKGMMKTVKIQDIDVRKLFWFQAPPLLSYLLGFSIEVSKE